MLVLPIKKKWFDMILSGQKKEEYREIKSYYDSRFSKYNIRADYYKPIGTVLFRNGYSKSSPTLKCNVECAIDTGKIEWGAEPGKLYYVLKILSIKELKMNKEITMDDYVLTNIDHKTSCFTIRLKDNKEYIVWCKRENGKTINFIEKDGNKILLSDDVVKAHLSAVREYQVSGI